MSNAQPATHPQSAAERKAAETQLRTLITRFASPHLKLIEAARRQLQRRLPAAYEVVYEYSDWVVIAYSPSEKGYDGVLAIRADADGVKFYFNRGKELPDPEKLLRGSASLVRFIDLESASTFTRPAVATLIDEAIARNPVPFAPTGRGPMLIRSAAKPKPQRRSSPSKAKTAPRSRRKA